MDAFSRIKAEEGFKGLYVGGGITMVRAMIYNMWMLVTNDEAKERIANAFPDMSKRKVAIFGSFTSAAFVAVGALPLDNVKTKLQNQSADASGKLPYNGMIDCITKSVAAEGITGLWSGLPTFYFRVGPHVVITLLVAETLRNKLL